MIGGMSGSFKDASWGQSCRDRSNDTTPPTTAARVAGELADIAVTLKTGSPVLGRIAGSITRDVVNEVTKPSSGSDLSQATLPKV